MGSEIVDSNLNIFFKKNIDNKQNKRYKRKMSKRKKKKENNFVMKQNHFSARVRVLMAQRKISVSELAKKIGKTDAAMSGILRYGHPGYDTLKKISELFGMSIEELMSPVSMEEYAKCFYPQKKEKNNE